MVYDIVIHPRGGVVQAPTSDPGPADLALERLWKVDPGLFLRLEEVRSCRRALHHEPAARRAHAASRPEVVVHSADISATI